MLRTTVAAPTTLDTAGVIAAYKNLAHVERDFRTLKANDLDLRPIHHRLEDRVRAHVFICMLAAYLTWHLRRTPGAADLHRRTPTRTAPTPSPPPHRSAAAARKASRRTDHDRPARAVLPGLLEHLATLTRNDIRYGATTDPSCPPSPVPTPPNDEPSN